MAVSKTDIANGALQHIGAPAIKDIDDIQSKSAKEIKLVVTQINAPQGDLLISGQKFSEISEDKLLGLASSLKAKVVLQGEAIDTICDAVLNASVGLKREHEPLGAFLFTGTTGVGKTETAKALAEVLGDAVRLGLMAEKHAAAAARMILHDNASRLYGLDT